MTVTQDVVARIAQLRRDVAAAHGDLTRYGLVAGTAGNVSARVPGADLLVTKPSGISYEDIAPENMVVTDLHGNLMDGDLTPSSDAESHAYVYRHMANVGGIVHTHSTYATAWAVRNEAVPCALTSMADEFGGEIPIGPFALIGDDSIGRGMVETLTRHRSPAVLMRNHGVFTVGVTVRDALKAAIMCEDAARTVHISRQLGEPVPVSRLHIEVLHARYQNVYGQSPTPPPNWR